MRTHALGENFDEGWFVSAMDVEDKQTPVAPPALELSGDEEDEDELGLRRAIELSLGSMRKEGSGGGAGNRYTAANGTDLVQLQQALACLYWKEGLCRSTRRRARRRTGRKKSLVDIITPERLTSSHLTLYAMSMSVCEDLHF
jgi:hypothetical protein